MCFGEAEEACGVSIIIINDFFRGGVEPESLKFRFPSGAERRGIREVLLESISFI